MTSRRSPRALRVHAAPATSLPPFDLDAVVIEQDRDLVLDVAPGIDVPQEPLDVLVQAIEGRPAHEPGTVLVDRRSKPVRLAALVHDFSAEPPSREAWVRAALDDVWEHAERLSCAALGMPALGSVHGRLSAERALELIEQSLWRRRPDCLEDLWLLLPAADVQALPARWDAAHDVPGRRTAFFC